MACHEDCREDWNSLCEKQYKLGKEVDGLKCVAVYLTAANILSLVLIYLVRFTR